MVVLTTLLHPANEPEPVKLVCYSQAMDRGLSFVWWATMNLS